MVVDMPLEPLTLPVSVASQLFLCRNQYKSERGKGISEMKTAIMMLVFLISAGLASACECRTQGRWEFVTLTGDTQYQLDHMGQSGLSTVLFQSGPNLINIPIFTTDLFYADEISNNNVTATGTVDSKCNVTITFTFGNNGDSSQPIFSYTYTGTIRQGTPTTIIGTYTTTVGSTFSTGSGNFEATFFPSFTDALYSGTLDGPDTGSGPTNVPILMHLTTNTDFSLKGTVEVPTFTDGHGNACFAGPLRFVSGQTEGSSYASGVYMEIFANDSLGRTIEIWAWSINTDGTPAAIGEIFEPNQNANNDQAGTNDEYAPLYAISGGPCDQLAGGGSPLHLIKKCNHQQAEHRHRNQH
jgi:hypothetical protein